jgi:V8-like Glu-specific endopeptidase
MRITPLGWLALSLLLPSALLSSCGATDIKASSQMQHFDPVGPNQNQGAEQPDPPLEDRIRTAANGILKCEFAGECHPAVVMLTTVVRKGVERCTGFLIRPDLVVTNDHCLDKSVAVTQFQGHCKNLIYAHFADVGRGPLTLGCHKIVARSMQSGIISRDYAVIQLSGRVLDRVAMNMASRGFKNNEVAAIYRVQMGSHQGFAPMEGTQTKLECATSYRTIVYPAVNSSRSPLMTFGDCPIQLGNSGSPVMNEDGDVGAIIQGFVAPEKNEKLVKEIRSYLLDPDFGEVALGTQMICARELHQTGLVSGGGFLKCLDVSPMRGEYPRQFVPSLGEMNPSLVLPRSSTGHLWKHVRSLGENEQVWMDVPACVRSDQNGFETSVVKVARGLNRRLQAEWRVLTDLDAQRSSWQRVSEVSSQGRVLYRSDTGGQLEFNLCSRTKI